MIYLLQYKDPLSYIRQSIFCTMPKTISKHNSTNMKLHPSLTKLFDALDNDNFVMMERIINEKKKKF